MFVNGALMPTFAAVSTPHVLSANRGTTHTATYTNMAPGGYFTGREWVGDIGEVLVYTSSLTTQQRLLNEAYLYGKWLALAPNSCPIRRPCVAEGPRLTSTDRRRSSVPWRPTP